VDRFKAITSGDLITVERKHELPFTTRLFTKLIFSGNHLPIAADRSEAYYRRWNIVPFPYTFIANPRTARRLKTELTGPGELSGLFNKALQALPKVLSDGISESESMAEVMREFRGGDQLEAWLNQQTVMSPDAFVVMRVLWEAFNKDTGCGMMLQAFGRRLRQLRPTVGDAQRRVSGQVVWVYTGLEFRSPRVSRE
jgi:putative DNA primase/helicase